jgi:FkbM family methyltransferase
MLSDRFQRWLYDLPKIGQFLRKQKYKKVFDSLAPGEIAIDLGANVGSVTRRMLGNKGGVLVYAFEPDPFAFKKLAENFQGVENVICLNKAVSDHAGIAKIYFHQRAKEDPIKWSVASSLFAEKGNVDKDNFVECDVIDFGDFVNNLDRPIGLLKMDIEGEEIKVINQLIDRNLVSKIRNIVVETHERLPFLKQPTEDLRKKILNHRIKNIDLNWA